MPRTLQQLAQEALDVQDACNLSGVAHGFARAMSDLCDHVHDTGARNRHPIAILWADKIAHLTGTQHIADDVVMRAYPEVEKLAGQAMKLACHHVAHNTTGRRVGELAYCGECHAHQPVEELFTGK